MNYKDYLDDLVFRYGDILLSAVNWLLATQLKFNKVKDS